ncbi:carbohydrate kinase [Chitinimonas sp. BJYL2]|uniref:carbohydrate kinase family protein n=1 Tax=Chitinimonas sp. BJYL2 TaxID=2976696 RepID=UPI0022B4F311|nr:carbohydrate kinase [Chitinimonas sp. BJYL2]
MKPLLAFGEALIDLLQDPAEPSRYYRNAGGAPANVAVGFAKLGGPAAFIGMLARDSFGQFLQAELAGFGVDTRWLSYTDAANTALAVVSLADGERSFHFYRPPSADLLFSPADFDAAAFADAPLYHFCSNTLTHADIRASTQAGLALATKHGCLISFDVNLRPSLWPAGTPDLAGIRTLLPQVQVLKCSLEEWQALAEGDEAALIAHCLGGQTRLILITDGSQPLRWITRDGAGTLAVEAVPVLDSTAAGDAFVAGLLYQLARDDITAAALDAWLGDASRLQSALRFASRCGGLACTRYGAFAALPTMAELSA